MIPQIEIEINLLKENLLELSGLVYSQLKKLEQVLQNGDKNICKDILRYEKRIDGLELNIEKEVENILARYNPVANDLRFLISSLKINVNLERIGDNAKSIANIIKNDFSPFNKEIINLLELEKMVIISSQMLNICIDAIENDATVDLRQVFVEDEKMNEIRNYSIKRLSDFLPKNQQSTENCFYAFIIVRKLERIGDHIKNIAEEIIFHYEAKIIRHEKLKKKMGHMNKEGIVKSE